MALARTVHIYITLFAFLGLLLFSVSGFLLHHDAWFNAKDYPDQPTRKDQGDAAQRLAHGS